jgi:GntR family transcriptional regulator, transcriptional repressor for pyruvate dehydrogenase complex
MWTKKILLQVDIVVCFRIFILYVYPGSGGFMNSTRKDLIQRLLNLLSKGEIAIDGKLPSERELASVLNTSRPLLREALISLEALGYLDIRDRQGIFLTGENPNEALQALGHAQVWPMEILSQVMEIRQIMDPGATALAAMRRKSKDMDKLNECISMLEKIYSEHDPDEASLGAYWNKVLHSTIFNATGNTLLARLYESLLEMSEKGVSAMRKNVLNFGTADTNEQVLEQHRNLVAAIQDKNIERAREASKAHLKYTIDSMVRMSRVTPVSNFFAGRMVPILS